MTMDPRPIKQTRGLVAILLALVTVAAAVANPVSAQVSPVTLTPNQDAYVDESDAASNFGTETSLFVQSRNGGRNARTFVQFDLSSIPSDHSVQTATLRLYMYNTPRAVRTYQVRRVTGAWTESGITWINQASAVSSASDAASTPVNPGWMEWDVTADVQAIVNLGQTNRGWRISDLNEGQTGSGYLGRFVARDYGTNPSVWPQLVVDYTNETPTPTPISTATPTNTPLPPPTATPTPTPTATPAGARSATYDDFELCAPGTSSGHGEIREKPPGLRECGNVVTNPDFETTILPWVTGAGTLDAVRSSRYSCDSDGRVNSFNVGTYSLLFRCDRLHGYGGYPFQPWAYQDFTVPDFVSTTQEIQTELNVSLYYVVPPESATVVGRAEDELRVNVQDAGGTDLMSPVVVANGGIASRGAFHGFSMDLGSAFSLADYAGDTLRLRFDAPNDDGLGNSEFFLDQIRCEICTTVQPPDPEPGMAERLGGHLLVVLAGQPTEMQGIDVWVSQLPDETTPLDELDFQYTYSIQDSTYSFYNLNPGTYRIYAEVWVSGNQYSAVQTVTIGAGETNVDVDMTLI
jgi:hypothetical protein